MVHTSEGFTWTPSGGVRHGLPTIGVVVPPTHSIQPEVDAYDVIVIGSGYAGLVASRDLATQGQAFLFHVYRQLLTFRRQENTPH
jgi:hypothetical protein